MAREGISLDLRTAVAKAIKQHKQIRLEHVRSRHDGHSTEISIEVIPFPVPPASEKFYLVLFESSPVVAVPRGTGKAVKSASHASPSEPGELMRLREELAATRESLQSIIEEQETTNEGLQSANEEIMSSYEELQSTNE